MTPAPDGTSGSPEAPADSAGQGFDFERSYNELRPEYTRTTQELATQRERLTEYESLFEALHDSDPEIQRQAMDALGLELEAGSPGTEAPSDEFVDPLEQEIAALRETVSTLQSARERDDEQQDAERVTAMRDDFIGEAISFIESETKATFSAKEEEALGNLAIAMEDDSGVPDVKAAYNLLFGDDGVLEINRGRWIESKTGAPQPPLGKPPTEEQRPRTSGERMAYIDERMARLSDQA